MSWLAALADRTALVRANAGDGLLMAMKASAMLGNTGLSPRSDTAPLRTRGLRSQEVLATPRRVRGSC
jgi:hypothetical protein